MRLLLDSHALLWALAAPEKLRSEARDAICDPGNTVFFSPASIWELEIKVARGRLKLPEDWIDSIGESGFLELVIHQHHAQTAARLPWFHSDPFDRMLIAQAKLDELHLVSRDQFAKGYGVPIVKA